MKCPLLSIGKRYKLGAVVPLGGECIIEECAWWDKKEKACAVFSLKYWVAGLAISLADIQSKMPHGAQSRK